MLILNVDKISKDYGYGMLFEELSFSLNEGERISVVGANGCGKSTLLRIIAGIENSDQGVVNIKKGAKIAFFEQTSSDKYDSRMVEDVLQDAYTEIFRIEEMMNNILYKIENLSVSEDYEYLINKYDNLYTEFQNQGGYDISINIDKVCAGLKISKEMRSTKYEKLSGGEKTLVHLAKALMQKPDIFLLDEPTNHLDISKIEWLESYIINFKGAVVTVSHDRKFLDNISDKILEIDNGEGIVFNTNYTGYLEEKEKRFEILRANWEEQQAYFKRLEDEAKRLAQVGMATNSKVMTRKAGVMFSRIEREKEKIGIKRPVYNKKIRISFNEFQGNSKRAIELKEVTVFVEKRRIINNINMIVSRGEKIAIVGANGSGKSTIIKTIVGKQELSVSGEVIVSPSLKIGYLPQIIDFNNEDIVVLEYFRKETELNEEKSRSILSRFLFDREDMFKRVRSLSGGERIRLKLAILLQQEINALVFDEPTNHIDIPTKEALERAIENFEGTVIAVSHDRFFINKFAEKVFELADGVLKMYLGDYTDYLNKKLDDLKEEK